MAEATASDLTTAQRVVAAFAEWICPGCAAGVFRQGDLHLQLRDPLPTKWKVTTCRAADLWRALSNG